MVDHLRIVSKAILDCSRCVTSKNLKMLAGILLANVRQSLKIRGESVRNHGMSFILVFKGRFNRVEKLGVVGDDLASLLAPLSKGGNLLSPLIVTLLLHLKFFLQRSNRRIFPASALFLVRELLGEDSNLLVLPLSPFPISSSRLLKNSSLANKFPFALVRVAIPCACLIWAAWWHLSKLQTRGSNRWITYWAG